MSTDTATKHDRRRFLRNLGVGLGMLPLLESELARAAGKPPLRFMSFVVTNGMPVGKFFPGAGFTMSETCSLLDPVKDKIAFVDGLQLRSAMDAPVSVAGHHDLGCVLTGVPLLEYSDPKAICVAGGPSIDQHIVAHARLSNPQEPRPLLIAYKPGREPQTSWKGARAPETAESDLFKTWNSVFATAAPAVTPAVTPADLDKLRAARKSMLDVVGKDLERFCKNLGTDDRTRCASHLQSFRELEKDFGMKTGPAPTPLSPPGTVAAFSSDKVEDMQKYMDALIKLVPAVLAANRTRVINFTFGDSIGDSLSYPHLGFPRNAGISIYDGGSGVDHGEAHNNTKVHMAARKWLMGEVGKLISAMSKIIEPGGKSLLDSSVIYVTPNMSTGGSHDIGRVISMPTMYAGSLGGYLKTGTSVKLPSRVATNRLFHAFFGAMNVDPAGFDKARYGTELTELRA
jgi:hypothetical protein